ncbi:transcription repressor NadR [Dellaglioa carnosa]|uniref:transcription repressor NadR n=1 Tax=Dellaglioa carnosa TaxID=2995136 RepID=UPI0022A826B4|nr:transcription repressor NadR [Dellaglioa carnosa]MCZ2492112.1 transcription repressor NadR [Dellaglioa carnosa]
MNGKDRQENIKEQLYNNANAISANQFAQQFKVSRQTIVGDIALLRAQGEQILASFNGYTYDQEPNKIIKMIVCKHRVDRVQEELELLIRNGAEVQNVTINHEIYGELSGTLLIKTENDINEFMTKLNGHKGRLLSELTAGIHTHLIKVASEESFAKIQQELFDAGLSYQTD